MTGEKPCVLSLSYGKDSIACIGAIQALGWRLDRIIHAEIWATDTIPADLPPMVAFKKCADEIILQMTGIKVEHIRANVTYEQQFYAKFSKEGGKRYGKIYGWPLVVHHSFGGWCNSRLKVAPLKKALRGCVQYIGIAADEPARFHSLSDAKRSPLVEAGWTESDCRTWCVQNNLFSPIYSDMTRGGCWFCHNQPITSLRYLREHYPDYWALMLKWDADSEFQFRADGRTVHDFERRFAAEDVGAIDPDAPFRWSMLDGQTVMGQVKLWT